MLGPALTRFLERLADIPDGERTEEQKALFAELRALFAAFPVEQPNNEHAAANIRLRKRSEFNLFAGYTAPYTGPYQPGEKCHRCEQYFPVATQPP